MGAVTIQVGETYGPHKVVSFLRKEKEPIWATECSNCGRVAQRLSSSLRNAVRAPRAAKTASNFTVKGSPPNGRRSPASDSASGLWSPISASPLGPPNGRQGRRVVAAGWIIPLTTPISDSAEASNASHAPPGPSRASAFPGAAAIAGDGRRTGRSSKRAEPLSARRAAGGPIAMGAAGNAHTHSGSSRPMRVS